MPSNKSPALLQKELDHSMPVARDVKLGLLLVNMLAAMNAMLVAANTAVLTKAGLVIHGAASPLAKAANAFMANVNGVIVRKAAATDMAALAGNLATAKSAAWPFYINAAGVLSTGAKTADAASHDAAVALIPDVPAGLAQIGVVVIDNATGANFVGGTTALDAASLTVTYYDTPSVQPHAANALLTATLGPLGTLS